MHNKDIIFDIDRNMIGVIKARCDEFHLHNTKVINSLKENSTQKVNMVNTSITNSNENIDTNKSEVNENITNLITINDESIY